MTKYTPEPWRYVGNGELWAGEGRDEVSVGYAHTDADGERIVACVNACAGMANLSAEYRAEIEARKEAEIEERESNSWAQLAVKLANERDTERAKVARLVEALEHCMERPVPGTSYIDNWFDLRNIAETAIREAKEEGNA